MIGLLRGKAERATRTLPLFPLRAVLFPGGQLPLRVFEQRYIEMVTTCMRNSTSFGICLITHGHEVLAADREGSPLLPAFANVGTLASIRTWDMPELGILHLAIEGGSRFRVLSHEVRGDGLALAEVVPIANEPALPLAEEYTRLRNFLELLVNRLDADPFPAERYEDASWVSYRLAELLPLPLTAKQSMLEINDSSVRLKVQAQFLEQQRLL